MRGQTALLLLYVGTAIERAEGQREADAMRRNNRSGKGAAYYVTTASDCAGRGRGAAITVQRRLSL